MSFLSPKLADFCLNFGKIRLLYYFLLQFFWTQFQPEQFAGFLHRKQQNLVAFIPRKNPHSFLFIGTIGFEVRPLGFEVRLINFVMGSVGV